MKNIIDYVESEFSSMNDKKFNAVDSLILSQVTNFFYDDLVGNINNPKPPVYFKDLLPDIKPYFFKFSDQDFYK